MANETVGLKLSPGDTLDTLTKIGRMAYGVKYGKGASGGSGYVGMVGDKVVKFNTHWSERRGPVTQSMRESCDQLRSTLYGLMSRSSLKNDQTDQKKIFASLCKDLGYGLDGKLLENRPLLSRKVVARVVTELSNADPKLKDIWSGVKEAGVSTRQHTAYATYRRAEDLSSFKSLIEHRLVPERSGSQKLVRKGLRLTDPEAPEKRETAGVDPECQKRLIKLAENVYSGKTNLTDAFKSLGDLLEDIGQKSGMENVKTVDNLRSFSVELARAAASGKRARGLAPASAPKTLTQFQLKTIDEAIGRMVDGIMKDFDEFQNDATQNPALKYGRYKVMLNNGRIQDRDVMLEQIKAKLYASDKLLEFVQKETDHQAMGELHGMFQKFVGVELEKMKTAKKTVEESVEPNFPREINAATVASHITINGENQEKEFKDDGMVLSNEEREKIEGEDCTKGGQRIAKNVIGLVPEKTPARLEIVKLITTFMCPVSGPVGQCGTMWDLGFGTGLSNFGLTDAEEKVGNTTDSYLPSTTWDLRLENDKIILDGKFDVGVTCVFGNCGKAFIPKNHVSYTLEISLNQPPPKSPENLQYKLYTSYT